MIKHTLMAAAVAGALAGPGTAAAVTESEMKELREQVRQLKQEYERRIDALEQRLKQAEGAAGKAQSSAGQAEAAASEAKASAVGAEAAAASASIRPAGENAFNPAVSLILNGVMSNLKQDPARHQIAGFTPTGGEVGPGNRGLNLAETELVFSANIDPNFRGTLIAKLGADDTVGIEEGFIQTLGLSNGLTARAGRFLAGVGYLNEIHPHAWDFADAPLASKVFLGNQLGEDGVQVKWVAPTDLYFDAGMELGRGRKFPAGPDNGRNKNGIGSANVFAHLGGDIGTDTAWQVGLSHLRTQPRDRTYQDADAAGINVTNSFSGSSRLWVLSGVLKWAPQGNSTINNLKLQGEYFSRDEGGDLVYDSGGASRGAQSGAYSSKQSGWYGQAVYQFAPQWRAGYRYDRLNAGSSSIGLVSGGARLAADFPVLERYSPTRNTWMIDWSGSEFSRWRLQFAQDKSRAGAPDNQVALQYIMSLGAHGVHKF